MSLQRCGGGRTMLMPVRRNAAGRELMAWAPAKDTAAGDRIVTESPDWFASSLSWRDRRRPGDLQRDEGGAPGDGPAWTDQAAAARNLVRGQREHGARTTQCAARTTPAYLPFVSFVRSAAPRPWIMSSRSTMVLHISEQHEQQRPSPSTAASAPGLSPSSSMGSLSSDKSSLNPNAKEFKLNPNAKSFTPVTSPLRPPHPPASDAAYYYPNMPTTPGPGLPVGMGFPQAYGGQPMVYNAQPGSSPQGYMHPSGQQYGQQMMMGQTRPVYYYAPEMQQYRGGRNY